MRKSDENIIIYSIVNEKITPNVDSPPLDIFSTIQLYNILRDLNIAYPLLFIEPVGILNKGIDPQINKSVLTNSSILFHYSSFHRIRGLYSELLRITLKKFESARTVIFLDLYNGSFLYDNSSCEICNFTLKIYLP